MANIIDKSSGVPLYLQLKEILADEIGKMQPDQMIEPESALIKKYGVSRTTVRQAIAELIKTEHLYTIRGKGTFTAARKGGFRYMNKIESFSEQIIGSGMEPETKILQKTIVLANDEVAKGLGISKGQGVLYLKRLRYADGNPLNITESYLPLPQCAALAEYDLGNESLFAFFEKELQIKVAHVHRKISAAAAVQEDMELLAVPQQTPLLCFINQSYDEEGNVIEFNYSRFRVDVIPFSVDLDQNVQ